MALKSNNVMILQFWNVAVCFAAMKKYEPTDATTNPSLILQASQKPQYSRLIDDAVAYAKQHAGLVSVHVCVCKASPKR